jgi:hypothetical protein
LVAATGWGRQAMCVIAVQSVDGSEHCAGASGAWRAILPNTATSYLKASRAGLLKCFGKGTLADTVRADDKLWDFKMFFRCVSNLLKSSLLLSVYMTALFDISSNSFAETKLEKREEIILTYLKRAFSYDGKTKLRKFDLQGSIPISFECRARETKDCTTSFLLANDAMRVTKNLKFKQSGEPKFRIIFVDKQKAEVTKQELIEIYVGGVAEVSDKDCQVVTSQIGSAITKAAIVVSVDQAALRQKTCVTIQLSQALGLTSPANLGFSELWNEEPNGYKHLNEEKFLELRHTSTILNSIHMCPSLMSGMQIREVIAVLAQENSICMNDIGGF